MRILVTGASGFVGRHLLNHLGKIQPQAEIFALSRNGHHGSLAVDMADPVQSLDAVSRIRPDQIYHLAGTYTQDVEADFRNNALSSARLMEAVRKTGLRSRILLTGSSAEYGIPGSNPVPEDAPLNPVSVYGASKAYQSVLMRREQTLHGTDVLMVRPFNLMGTGMSEELFVGSIQRQIRDYKQGKTSKIKVGDLSARRDYIDICDALTTWVTVMQKGITGEVYNIGSGISVPMRELLKEMLASEEIALDQVEECPVHLPARLQVDDIYADTAKTNNLFPTPPPPSARMGRLP